MSASPSPLLEHAYLDGGAVTKAGIHTHGTVKLARKTPRYARHVIAISPGSTLPVVRAVMPIANTTCFTRGAAL